MEWITACGLNHNTYIHPASVRMKSFSFFTPSKGLSNETRNKQSTQVQHGDTSKYLGGFTASASGTRLPNATLATWLQILFENDHHTEYETLKLCTKQLTWIYQLQKQHTCQAPSPSAPSSGTTASSFASLLKKKEGCFSMFCRVQNPFTRKKHTTFSLVCRD